MTVKTNVHRLLIEKPITRDFDHKLIAYYWATYNGATRYKLAMMLWEGKLTSAESIRRTRQELNETYPETRGLSYNNRQQKGKEETTKRRKIKYEQRN